MTRLLVAVLCTAAFALSGCDNRTRGAVRWDQIAKAQQKDKSVQPWSEAKSPWGNAEHLTGTAW
jgi:hypothetical protein